jgi:hypothetical protein
MLPTPQLHESLNCKQWYIRSLVTQYCCRQEQIPAMAGHLCYFCKHNLHHPTLNSSAKFQRNISYYIVVTLDNCLTNTPRSD